MISTLTKASTRIVPWMNRVGRSTATAPAAATCPAPPPAKMLLDAATRMVRMNAAPRPPNASTRCRPRRAGRGANASTSTPASAAPKTTSIGASWLYSMCGAAIADAASTPGWPARPTELIAPVTVRFPSAPSPDAPASGSVMCTWTMVWCTAGLMTSSTGLG